MKVERTHEIAQKVLIVDGLSRSGKAMVSATMQGLQRVENVNIDYTYDYLCVAHHFGQVTTEGFKAISRMMADVRLYNNMCSREVNFRPNDLTSVLKQPMAQMYLSRLFLDDRESIVDRIESDEPILHLMLHQSFAASKPVFDSFGNRLVYVESTRHPIFMVKAWYDYIERYGNDPREFTLSITADGQPLPWWVHENADNFINSNRMDKVIIALSSFANLRKKNYDNLTAAERERYVEVCFEKFVRNPEDYINRISGLLETDVGENFSEILREQNIPRTVSNAGIKGLWTEEYGEVLAGEGSSEEKEMTAAWNFVEEKSSSDGLKLLREVCDAYEKMHEI